MGSAIYEIMAWVRPFKGLGDAEVEARYAREEFPSLADITVGPVIWDVVVLLIGIGGNFAYR